MKITFFRNVSDFADEDYNIENAERAQPKFKLKLKNARLISLLVFTIAFSLYCIVFSKYLAKHLLSFLLIFCLQLPAHEFCHALYCWLTGRKAAYICFFPYNHGFTLTKPGAYVKPEFCAWRKSERVLLSIFPLLILSVFPAVLSLFFPTIRIWLCFSAVLNVVGSSYDIVDALYVLSYPKGSVYLENFAIIPKKDVPVIIHKIYVAPDRKEIRHQQLRYDADRLTETFPPVETVDTKWLRGMLAERFNL